MNNTVFNVPQAANEPVKDYHIGSPERKEIKDALTEFRSVELDIPMIIGGKEIRTGNTIRISPPHDHQHTLGYYHRGTAEHVKMAIDAALEAKEAWENLDWKQRASIFLKAAGLVAGPYRARLNAATMLGQSKSVHQAEIDAACEMADFLRFNVEFMAQIYSQQPASEKFVWNRTEHRALEGFVFALSPFNFTSIAGNLPAAPALMGNTVVWKTSNTQIYSAKVLMDIFTEAGVPAGVINLIFVSGPVAGDVIFSHPMFAGIHFTGSTEVFRDIWTTIGKNIAGYRSYPRIVGETGGKNFVLMHPSANPTQVATALVRGAFEFQGQKCSAASRAYIPKNRWSEVWKEMQEDLNSIKMGGPENFSNFVNAVIDEASFEKITGYIKRAEVAKDAKIIAGGTFDKSVGYFIKPTVILTTNAHYETMEEEIFGPILTVYLYDENKFEETVSLVDNTSIYALTGSIFSLDRYAIDYATKHLRNSAGNFYINDKPTGAVVNQQPFGGARASGTNDKAGSMLNLLRWVSPRSIKETFLPPVSYKYPFMVEKQVCECGERELN